MESTPAQRSSKPMRLFWGIFFIAVGFAFLAPTRLDIAILLPEVMHGIGVASLSAGGLISTLTVLGDGLSEPFMGRLSDKLSRRFSLAVGIAVFSLFSLLTAVAANLTTMVVVRILLGVGQAIFTPAYFAFLGGAFGKRRGLVLGSLAGLFTVGAAINPLATRAIFNAAGKAWQAPFVVYGIFGLVLALVVFGVGYGRFYEMGRTRATDVTAAQEDQAVREGKSGVLGRGMLLLLVAMLCWGLTQYAFLGLFVTFLRVHQHFSLGVAASIASIAGWTSFAFSFLGGWISDYVGRRRALMAFGCISLVVSYPLFTMTSSFWPALILAAVFEAANGMYFPLGIAYGQDMARAQHLGGHSGAVSGVGHIAAGVAGLVAGSIASVAGFGAVGFEFVIGSAIMVGCIYFTVDPVRALRLAERDKVRLAIP